MNLADFRRKLDNAQEGIQILQEEIDKLFLEYEREYERVLWELAKAKAADEIKARDAKLKGGQYN